MKSHLAMHVPNYFQHHTPRPAPLGDVLELTMPAMNDPDTRTIRAHLDARKTGILVEEFEI